MADLIAFGVINVSTNGLLSRFNIDNSENAARAEAMKAAHAWRSVFPDARIEVRRIVNKRRGWAYA